MAARLNNRHQSMVRDKIQTSQLINRLMKHGLGELELTPSQVASIRILLDKTLPNLSAVEQTNISTDNPEHMTDQELIEIAKKGNVSPIKGKQAKG